MAKSLKVCYVTSEVAPFAKTGGLADVVSAALPVALQAKGVDVRLFLPRYGAIDPAEHALVPVDFAREVPVELGDTTYNVSLLAGHLPGSEAELYFVDCPELFRHQTIYSDDGDEGRRFALLAHAAVRGCQQMGWGPDVFHTHDWHAALLPLLLKTTYSWDALFHESRTLHTIHNISYQGVFPAGLDSRAGSWLVGAPVRPGRLRGRPPELPAHTACCTPMWSAPSVRPTRGRSRPTLTAWGWQDLLRARRGNVDRDPQRRGLLHLEPGAGRADPAPLFRA